MKVHPTSVLQVPNRLESRLKRISRESTELFFGKSRSLITAPEVEATFHKFLTEAAKWHIPHGCINEFKPHFKKQAVELSKTRDELQSNNPGDPNISRLNIEIDALRKNTNSINGLDLLLPSPTE